MEFRHRIEFTQAYFSATNLLCQRNIVRGDAALCTCTLHSLCSNGGINLIQFLTFTMSRVMRKPTFCICKNKGADQLLINAFSPYTDNTIPLLLNPKFPASSHRLCLYSSGCVRPIRKPRCWFSHDVAQYCSFCNFDP